MCIGAIIIPISLFGFAWTSTPNIHWIVPILFSLPFGTAYVMVFNAMLLYLIDCYEIYTASVLAANSFMRFAFGATFPLFVPRLYGSLGTHWAGTRKSLHRMKS